MARKFKQKYNTNRIFVGSDDPEVLEELSKSTEFEIHFQAHEGHAMQAYQFNTHTPKELTIKMYELNLSF